MSACIVPVSLADAEQWALGLASDADLLLRATLTPEAVFIASLPDLASYRQTLRDVVRLWRSGCRVLIARTSCNAVFHHLTKNGCEITCFDNVDGKALGYLGPCRFIAGPEALEKWLGKFTRRNKT